MRARVCVCVCVCERERRVREIDSGSVVEKWPVLHISDSHQCQFITTLGTSQRKMRFVWGNNVWNATDSTRCH